jgi:L-fucose isomerase-like protein
MDFKVKLGFAPTRRGGVFVNPDALKYKKLIMDKLRAMNIDFVDIEDINDEGLLMGPGDVPKVVGKFKAARINAVFFPHCNFGSEHSVARTAAELNLPTLLWGPRDEAPQPDGSRLRDTQCGLFATGKVLRRMKTPFTYLPNCHVSDDTFELGLNTFLAASNVVKEFRSARILQIGPRPYDFWTMMCNEGELLEKFGIQIFPISMTDITARVKALEASPDDDVTATVEYMKKNMNICVEENMVLRLAALKTAMKLFAVENDCNAVAIQCWYSLQDALGIMPCAANSLLTDEGIPVACETDIHGAISSIMIHAAGMGKSPSFFVDWSIRHPENPNGELLQHCGPWPLSLAKEKPTLGKPFAFSNNCPGSVRAEIRGGEMTIIRFDGDNGEYGVLLGTARGIDGPATNGTYVWVELPNWPKIESMIVKGPYVHHASAIHGNLLPVIWEALTYIPGVRADFYDENQMKATTNDLF